MENGSMRSKTIRATAEQTAQTAALVAALLAIAGFLIPPLGTLVNLITAWRFGATGYVYYEIGPNRTTTADSRWYLPRAGSGTYADLAVGDKLQEEDDQFLREHPAKDASPFIFVLRKADCVIVLHKDHEVTVQKAVSGGWLKVATSACGLFR